MIPFKNQDTYKITHSKKDEKFSIDSKVLIRLYGPVIGSNATSLYLTLDSELSLNKYVKLANKIDRLTKITSLSINKLNEAFLKLESYGLITVKWSKKLAGDSLITLNKTKTATEFFNDKKLTESLEVEVDGNYYQQVYDYFMVSSIDEDDYDDIPEVQLNKIVTEEDFYKEFERKYPTILNSLSISDKDKQEIRRLAKLFNLDYEKVERAILNSFDFVDDSYKINLTKLNDFVEKEYATNKAVESAADKQIKAYENANVYNFYANKVNKVNILPSETNQIDLFLDQYNVSQGVLNVVLDYCYRYRSIKGYITSSSVINYMTKVLTSLSMNNVNSVADAMNYFKSLNKTNTQQVKVEEKIETKPQEETKSSDTSVYDKLRKLMMEDED